MKSVYSFLSENWQAGGFAIATVISSSGSSPGRAGTSALITREGLLYGTVGGGIAEKKVIETAAGYVGNNKSGVFHYNLGNTLSDHNEAVCGGTMKVLIDSSISNDSNFSDNLKEIQRKKIPYVVVTSADILPDGEYFITRALAGEAFFYGPEILFSDEVRNKISELLAPGRRNDIFVYSSLEAGKESYLILESVFRPPRLVIAGAGHIGKAVCMLGNFLGFEVTVIDDRPEFVNKTNLPGADNILAGNIGEAIKKVEKDRSTFIVIVTRGHSNDSEALRNCIASDAAYIGMIGSRTKTELMRKEFISRGWATQEQWEKIHTPVGIKINSVTVEEIAVSIAAELVMVKNSSGA